MTQCLYVTRGWGVHDERWVAALTSQAFEPLVLQVNDDLANLDDVCAEIRRHPDQPILAGPLAPVTEAIIQDSSRIVGLSWGFDLHQATDLAWLRRLAGLIVDSTATQRIAIDAGMPAEKIALLPWGVDLTLFTPEGASVAPTAWGLPLQTRLLLSLRAHEALYRTSDIIEAFSRIASNHPDVALLIGNEGSLTNQLHQHVKEHQLQDRVRFIGRIAEDQLPPLMRGATAYITASEVDGTSVTLLQAVACGAPVIASNNPGNGDWVSTETGLTFDVGSIDQLAQALERVLDEPDQAQVRAQAALRSVTERADWLTNRVRLGEVMRQAAS